MPKKDKASAYKRRQDGKPRSELSQNESTKRNREWEKSKIGIEGALLKIKRSRRTYIWRKKQAMMKDPKWLAYSEAERASRLSTLKDQADAKYNTKRVHVITEWESMQERLDVEDVCSSSSEGSYSEAQENEDDGKDIDEKLTEKEKLAVRVGVEAILNNLRTDIDDAMKPFEVIGSYDEGSAENSSEEDERDSSAEDEH